MIWVDPPSGWKYGFPKMWDGKGDSTEWLIANGYPKAEIESCGDYFFARSWEATPEDMEKNK